MVDIVRNRAVDGHEIVWGRNVAKCPDRFLVHGSVPIWMLQNVWREHVSRSGDDLEKIVVFPVGPAGSGVSLLIAKVGVVSVFIAVSD